MLILHNGAHSMMRKIVVTALVGGLSFPLTNLLFASAAVQFVVSAAVGAVILIIQFLIEVDQRLSTLEVRQIELNEATRAEVRAWFGQISEATRLFGRVETMELRPGTFTELARLLAEIDAALPPTTESLVQREFDHLGELLHGIKSGRATYPGEDRNWILSLTFGAQESIDAISLPAVDAGGEVYHAGFWNSDLGQRYLQLQHEAVQRGVRVRRIFVLNRPELAKDPDVLRTCREQAHLGISVRLLSDVTLLPRLLISSDFILFDDTISYVVTPGDAPLIQSTQLEFGQSQVEERRKTFAKLWESAEPLPHRNSQLPRHNQTVLARSESIADEFLGDKA